MRGEHVVAVATETADFGVREGLQVPSRDGEPPVTRRHRPSGAFSWRISVLWRI